MKSLIAKLGNLMVMLHMALGCNLHHGVAQNCACDSEQSVSIGEQTADYQANESESGTSCKSSCHDHKHNNHNQKADVLAAPENRSPGFHQLHSSSDNCPCRSHHDHSGCAHDGCYALPLCSVDVQLDDDIAFVAPVCVVDIQPRNSIDNRRDNLENSTLSMLSSRGMRAHLVLGVQIL